jgi:hypothetical protein
MKLAIQKPSRRAPRAGDILAMQLPDRSVLFGRVIATDARPVLRRVRQAGISKLHSFRSIDAEISHALEIP